MVAQIQHFNCLCGVHIETKKERSNKNKLEKAKKNTKKRFNETEIKLKKSKLMELNWSTIFEKLDKEFVKQ